MIALRIIGWIFVPFIMIFLNWKQSKVSIRIIGTIWSILAFFAWVGALSQNGNGLASDQSKQHVTTHTAVAVAHTKDNIKKKNIKKETNSILSQAQTDYKDMNIEKLIALEKNNNITTEDKSKIDSWIAELKKPWEEQTKKDLLFMRTDTDQVENITFYTDKTSPKTNQKNAIYAYIATKKGYQPVLRIKIQYYGSDWLFVQKYIFNIDGTNYSITPDYGQVERDNNTSVWEWYDEAADTNAANILTNVANSKKTILRFVGQQYYKDIVITDAQKKAITNILNLYSDLKEESKWK